MLFGVRVFISLLVLLLEEVLLKGAFDVRTRHERKGYKRG